MTVAMATLLILWAVQVFRRDSRPISSDTTELLPGEEYVDEEGNAFSKTVSQSVEIPRHVAAVDRLVDEVERDLRENPGAWKMVVRTVLFGSTYGHWVRSAADVEWRLDGDLAPDGRRIHCLFVTERRVPLSDAQEARLATALEGGPVRLTLERMEMEEADLFNHAAEALAEAPSEIVAKSDVVIRTPGNPPRLGELACHSSGDWSGVWKDGEGVVGDDFTIKTPRKSPRKASKKSAGKA